MTVTIGRISMRIASVGLIMSTPVRVLVEDVVPIKTAYGGWLAGFTSIMH